MTKPPPEPHISASAQPSARRIHGWIAYLLGIPVVGVLYHSLFIRVAGEAQGIADSANPVLSPLHSIALTVLSFPMMYLWFPVGEWLKPHLTDDGVLSLFAKINALVWGLLVVRVGRVIVGRVTSKARRR